MRRVSARGTAAAAESESGESEANARAGDGKRRRGPAPSGRAQSEGRRGSAAAARLRSNGPLPHWQLTWPGAGGFQEMAPACQWARQAQVPNSVLRVRFPQGPQLSLACQLRRLACRWGSGWTPGPGPAPPGGGRLRACHCGTVTRPRAPFNASGGSGSRPQPGRWLPRDCPDRHPDSPGGPGGPPET